jgi:hypothetical protein
VVVAVWQRFRNNGETDLYGSTCKISGSLDNRGTIKGFGRFQSDKLIQNDGVIYASAGHLILHSYLSFANKGMLVNKPLASLHIRSAEDTNNAGTIEVNAGGGVVFDTNLVNQSGASVRLLGGTLAANMITQTGGADFEGFGGISGDVILDSTDTVRLTGSTNIVGSVMVEKDSTLEISDGQVLITGHTTCDGTIHIKGGSIVPQGGLSGDYNVVSQPSIYSNIVNHGRNGMTSFRNVVLVADTWLRQPNWQ